MIKKIFIAVVAIASAAALFFYGMDNESSNLRIGIVLPVQHAALDDIVAGFQSELRVELGEQQVKISVYNAMGDINLQRSIISKLINDKVDLVVPVSTSTTQMTLQLVPSGQSVLFLAANITASSAATQSKPALMGVIDEIPVSLQMQYLRAALPHLKKLSLIYSSSDKVYDDAESFLKSATQAGLTVQKLMVNNVAELYTVSQRVERSSEAIFILKDNVVASGVNALVQQASRLKIPLISSDEGSIKNGGTFALGVVEADIGRQGARMAANFFKHEKLEKSIQQAGDISVFINEADCINKGLSVASLAVAAHSMKLSVNIIR